MQSLFYKILCRRPIKHSLERIPFVRRVYSGWSKIHPFDTFHGTDTSGYVGVEDLTSDKALRKQINPYAASQPAILRKALAALPNLHEYTFVDIGCGKGRSSIVASEFPFEQIIGVELSADLVRVAQANSAIIRAKFPERTPITIVEANAVKFPLPPKKLVVFLCHSFGRELVQELINTITRDLASESIDHLFFMYYNPVFGDMFDSSPAFARWYAEIIPYDESEIGFGPDLEDAVVVWQSVRKTIHPPRSGANRRIIIHKALWTAGLAV